MAAGDKLREAIKTYLQRTGSSERALSAAAGLNERAVSQILSGKSKSPRGQTLSALAQIMGTPVQSLIDAADSTLNVEMSSDVHKLTVREYEIRASPGRDMEPPQIGDKELSLVVSEWTVPTEFLPRRYRNCSPVILRVAGDSMEPEFEAEDPVLVDPTHRWPSPPGIYVLWDGYGMIVKQVELLPGSRPRVRLSSINPRYAPYEQDLDEVRIVGRVIAKWVWK